MQLVNSNKSGNPVQSMGRIRKRKLVIQKQACKKCVSHLGGHNTYFWFISLVFKVI